MFAGKLKRKLSSGNQASCADSVMSGTPLSDDQFLTQRHPNDPPSDQRHHGLDLTPPFFSKFANGAEIIDLTGDSSPEPEPGKNVAGLGSRKSGKIIDLTGDSSPEPVKYVAGLGSSKSASHANVSDTSACHTPQGELDDYKLALALQTKLDAEDSSTVGGASSAWQKKAKLIPNDSSGWAATRFDNEEGFLEHLSTYPYPFENSSSNIDMPIPGVNLQQKDEDRARPLQHKRGPEASTPRAAWNSLLEHHPSSIPMDSSTELEDRKRIHAYGQTIFQRRCRSCRRHFVHSENDITITLRSKWYGDRTFASAMDCKHCKHVTCIGCGQSPATMSSHRFESYTIGWHCSASRMYVIWAALCFPTHRDDKPGKSRTLKKVMALASGPKHKTTGVGYGDVGRRSKAERAVAFDQNTDAASDCFLNPLLAVLTQMCPSWHTANDSCSFDASPDMELLMALFRRSALMDKVAELLRNDSIDNLAMRQPVYNSLVNFLERLGSHPATSRLVYEERFSYSKGQGLLAVSFGEAPSPKSPINSRSGRDPEKMSSLLMLMQNFKSQAMMFSKQAKINPGAFVDEEAQTAVALSNRILEVYDFLAANGSVGDCKKAMPVQAQQSGSQQQDSVKPMGHDELAKWHRENCVGEMADEEILSVHEYAKRAVDVKQTAKGRMKKLVMELTTCRSSLPGGIYIRHGESRLDIMKALIVGPSGTPYENGLFEFDIFCGQNYPQSPPEVFFRTTGNGKVHFNPNLYIEGKGMDLGFLDVQNN
jgi:hypothetical protein